MAIKILSDLVDVISEHIPNPSTSGFKIFVGLEHYDSGEPIIKRYGTTDNLESSVKHFISGDILVARRNVYLRRAGVINFEGVTSGDSIVLRVKDKEYSDILPFILNSDDFWDYAEQNSDGTMSKRLAPDVLLEYECNISENHHNLADKLWAAYRLREGYKKLLAATDEMVKSQFIDMFGNPLFNTKKWRWYSNINNVVTIVLGSTPNTKEPKYWDGDIKWITPAEMDDETFMINDTLRHITEFGVKSANLTKLPVGSVLFSTRAPIGKVGIAAAEMYCNQGFKSFICSNQVDSIFLYYTLKLNKEYLCSLGTGTTFKELSKKTVEGLKLGVPPIDLQKQFAIIYKQADKSKFGGFKSQFIEMFGDCANRIKLSSLCSTFVDGDWIESKDQSEFGIRLIQTGNVGNGFFKDKEDKSRYISEETFDNLHCTEIYPGDILVSRLPDPIGRACIIPQGLGRTITAVDCTIIRLKDIILPDYFIAYTMTPLYGAQINEVTTGTTRRRVSRANLGNILIPCPSIAKQQQFVAIAKQADKSKSYVRIALKSLESMLGYCIRQVA